MSDLFALPLYLLVYMIGGDYRNDWLTHLPETLATILIIALN